MLPNENRGSFQPVQRATQQNTIQAMSDKFACTSWLTILCVPVWEAKLDLLKLSLVSRAAQELRKPKALPSLHPLLISRLMLRRLSSTTWIDVNLTMHDSSISMTKALLLCKTHCLHRRWANLARNLPQQVNQNFPKQEERCSMQGLGLYC